MMEPEEQTKMENQASAQVENGTTLSAPCFQTAQLKWRDVCEENAKAVAERLFTNLFIEYTITIPPDLTLSNIIEQFYQTLREKLKDLIQNKISDWEIRYPSLLLSANKLDPSVNGSTVEAASEKTSNLANQSYFSSTTSNDNESISVSGEVVSRRVLYSDQFHNISEYQYISIHMCLDYIFFTGDGGGNLNNLVNNGASDSERGEREAEYPILLDNASTEISINIQNG